ncbi:hypothetical protein [Clostridium cylindrosporum]|uniref:Uncharacterized protein n=1 Tax=Clostridium cylindrosporum DSM 605 TaxID=1121307 RepID=A0A0J8DEM8_CLOCY|nr:hypothetical protein [Clostridium cylindrosporum]KMT22694.1 hypothetical protein CLCY_11c00280 [Clostridium cylindrosporum DSM 605]
MIYILLSILLGAFTALTLIAPSEYYFILLLLPTIGIVLVFFLKKYIKKPSKYILISLPFIAILAYLTVSFIVFKPKKIELSDININNLSSNKKAVILYADGEMEKYMPYFSGSILSNKPYLIKPIESFKIKKSYESIEISKKNMDIIKISKLFSESLLKNGPHYFYLSYANYTPSLKESINSSLNDGCKDITILNFSKDPYATRNITAIKDSLKINNIDINISTPILKNLKPSFLLRDIPNDMSKFNGVLLLDKDNLGLNLKTELQSLGVDENSVFISDNVEHGLKLLTESIEEDAKNVLIINLLDFNNGIVEKYSIPKAIEKYENLSFQTVSPLKYDKDFLEIIVNEYKSIKKQP